MFSIVSALHFSGKLRYVILVASNHYGLRLVYNVFFTPHTVMQLTFFCTISHLSFLCTLFSLPVFKTLSPPFELFNVEVRGGACASCEAWACLLHTIH